jgi:hypothetical protein
LTDQLHRFAADHVIAAALLVTGAICRRSPLSVTSHVRQYEQHQ